MSESPTDMLIGRIASNEESQDEFAAFETSASAREWEQLARTLRDELQMRLAVNEALAFDARAEVERAIQRSRERADSPGFRLTRWSGWAVAAVLALTWTLVMVLQATDEMPASTGTAQFVSLTADEALDQYLRAAESEGRIVAELPAVLVESYPSDDGGLEVFYVRQFLERDRIAHVYNLAEDEHGSYVPVPVNPATLLSAPSSL